jgi:hypothetical protein
MFENCPAKKRIEEEFRFEAKCREVWQMFTNEGLFNARRSVAEYCERMSKSGNTEFDWDYVAFKTIQANTGGE